MPQSGFLFSIAGLSVTLVGFSGLLAALRRDAPRSQLGWYRLRQIPEMALASALVALISVPLADTLTNAADAVRTATAVALVFTIAHVAILFRRIQTQKIPIRGTYWIVSSLVDLALIAVAGIAIVTGTLAAYEWLLVLILARPAIAFVMALNDLYGERL